MNTKLTLSFNSLVIRKAKIFARRRNTSLSKIVEDYFQKITENQSYPDEISVTDEDILKMSGDIKLNKSVDVDDLLSDELIKKYIHD